MFMMFVRYKLQWQIKDHWLAGREPNLWAEHLVLDVQMLAKPEGQRPILGDL